MKREIAVVGLGGIGSWVLQGLAPYSAHLDEPYSFVLLDGDDYEQRNLSRQAFEQIGPKADVQANWITSKFPNLSVLPICEFLGPDFPPERVLREASIVFSCVDNHKTRKLLNDYALTRGDILLISGGNELIDGNVQFMWRKDAKSLTCDLDRYHLEIAEPKDRAPFEMSCEELSRSQPQLIFANMFAAVLMLNVFYAYEQNVLNPGKPEIYFDVRWGEAKARTRKA